MDVSVLQLIAYVSLTLASVTVAAASLFVAYRQNFGWPPTLLVTMRGSKIFNDSTNIAMFGYEIWNRRKYPIALRSMKVCFDRPMFPQGLGTDQYKREWRVSGEGSVSFWKNRDGMDGDIVLEPNSYKGFIAEAPFKASENDIEQSCLLIELTYFDPTANKHYVVTVPGKFQKLVGRDRI